MSKILKYQGYHLLGYTVIGALLLYATLQFPDGHRPMWGLSAREWILFSWILAAVHQSWVLFFWRAELYLGVITAWMGKAGFLVYSIGYIVSGLARLLPVIPISHSTAHTSSIPPSVSVTIIVVTTPLIIWGLYSVAFYFGVFRAFGMDHFDPAY